MKFVNLIIVFISIQVIVLVGGINDINDAENRLCVRMGNTEACNVYARDIYYPDDEYNQQIDDEKCRKLVNECMQFRNCVKNCRLNYEIQPYEQTVSRQTRFVNPCNKMLVECSNTIKGGPPKPTDPFIFL